MSASVCLDKQVVLRTFPRDNTAKIITSFSGRNEFIQLKERFNVSKRFVLLIASFPLVYIDFIKQYTNRLVNTILQLLTGFILGVWQKHASRSNEVACFKK